MTDATLLWFCLCVVSPVWCSPNKNPDDTLFNIESTTFHNIDIDDFYEKTYNGIDHQDISINLNNALGQQNISDIS